MSKEGRMHRVRQGESSTRLAYENGLFWETIWLHPRNSKLYSKRSHHNVLYPGDELFIPAIENKTVSGETEKKHRFVRKGVPEKLNIRFLDLEGNPYANTPYKLTIDGKHALGNLDGEGWLHASIPPNTRRGRVEVGQTGEFVACDLDLGGLDPITELTGVQARLRNLGFFDDAVDGDMSDELRQAILAFREKNGLPESNEIDEDFRKKLQEVHKV